MKRLVKPLALAAAGCAVAATSALAGTGKAPVAATPAAPTAAVPGKALPAPVPAVLGRAPKGYTIVSSGPLTSFNNQQTRGAVDCPFGTVPLGGGAFIPSNDQNININSSFPTTSGWVADVNNVSGINQTFDVRVVCAKAPRKYTIVSIFGVTNPADSQSSGQVFCPSNTVVLGGGSLSNSGSVAVNINSTLPILNGWRADINNNTTPDTTFDVFAICGKQLNGYSVVSSAQVVNPPSTQTLAHVDCPAGTFPLSGGGFSSSGSPAVDLNTTIPSGAGWDTYEDNTALIQGVTLRALAVCAA